ncbi:DUF3014 domain-containing protein [Cellvibrio sp. pealriver]|uniref:DUF3014 domain-containing protein n=1 Tax=Cellvibrio sp. pealriver TaxID=1622269 RepID=UPI00066FF066|nr:DUF3014 domain-containing protein [Cellvibrio sp. pealriver]
MSDDYQPRQSSSTSMIVIVVLVLIAVAAAFFFLRDDAPATSQSVVTPVAVAPQAVSSSSSSAAPIVEYTPPVPVVEVEPLPALNESDAGILAALQQLRGEGLIQLLVPQEVIRKFVLAVNNISEGKVIHEYRPVVSPPPPFIAETFSVMVEGTAVDQERIAPTNYQRYEAYVTTLALIDSDAAVAVYRRFYPLLEEAFRELGLKKPNFHSVMIAAIDNLLAAPDHQGDLLLVRPKVFYQYADPALEALPQTHKLMLRMGPENARSVKASLRQLRARLINQ